MEAYNFYVVTAIGGYDQSPAAAHPPMPYYRTYLVKAVDEQAALQMALSMPGLEATLEDVETVEEYMCGLGEEWILEI